MVSIITIIPALTLNPVVPGIHKSIKAGFQGTAVPWRGVGCPHFPFFPMGEEKQSIFEKSDYQVEEA
jgi:hypothetical protein